MKMFIESLKKGIRREMEYDPIAALLVLSFTWLIFLAITVITVGAAYGAVVLVRGA